MEPLEPLLELEGLPRWELPAALERLYGGPLGFDEPRVVTNFVETLDGVVALPDVPRSNRIVADESEADLFVMALLRACADAVIVGSHTLLASPKNRWTAEAAYPAAAGQLTRLRRSLVLEGDPEVVVLSRTRQLESEALGDRLAVKRSVADAIAGLQARGARRILCEGGPTLFGSLLVDGVVDELFVTLSPVVAGRGLSLVEGVELLPGRRIGGTLNGVRRHASHLFLRYALGR